MNIKLAVLALYSVGGAVVVVSTSAIIEYYTLVFDVRWTVDVSSKSHSCRCRRWFNAMQSVAVK
jgi:hypothetical protein